MTPQLDLDRRLRQAIVSDARIVCALAYGSLTQGTGDRYSDLEYYLFVPGALSPALDPQAFLAALTPVRHAVINEFGTPNFITDDLLRIELHVEPLERLSNLLSWPGYTINPGRMLVKDSGGQLAGVLDELLRRGPPDPRKDAPLVLGRLLNWLAFGANVLARGERLRALELLGWVRGGVLRLARLAENHTEHWQTASRLAEQELSPDVLTRFARLTGPLEDLERQYAEAWCWTQELAAVLCAEVDRVDEHLTADLGRRLHATGDPESR